MIPLAGCPWRRTAELGSGDHFSASLGVQLLGYTFDHNAPSGPVDEVDVIHFEGDVGAVDGIDLRPRAGAVDDRLAVESEVDREDQGIVTDYHRNPAYGLGGQ